MRSVIVGTPRSALQTVGASASGRSRWRRSIRCVSDRFAGLAGWFAGWRSIKRTGQSACSPPSLGTGVPDPHVPARCRCLFSDPGLWRAGRDQKSPLRRCFKPRPSKHRIFPVVRPRIYATTGTCEFGRATPMPERFHNQGFFRYSRKKNIRIASPSL
jgi:hypothetical protein